MPTLEKSHANRDKLYILASTPRSVSRRAGPEGAAAEGVGEWGPWEPPGQKTVKSKVVNICKVVNIFKVINICKG